jgi:MoaA/NifB/PqqE/SkfB family radical SAM enzyme
MRTERAFCEFPFNKIKITPEGFVNFCCHQHHTNSILGNILHENFESIWFSPKAIEIRNSVKNAKLHNTCNTGECPYRYQNLQNATIDIDVNNNGYPTHLEFDLHPSHCNFGGTKPTPETACIMCPRARKDFQNHLDATPDLTDRLAEAIAVLVPSLKEINILGVSEPFWKDKIFDVMQKMHFSQYKHNIEMRTTSNGSVFTPQRQQRFAEETVNSEICFSVDATTSDTYYKIRRQNLFQTVLDNIRHWCKLRRTLPGKHIVQMHNNINTLNVHEVPDMVRMAKDLDVDSLTLLPTHDCGGTFPELQPILVNASNAKVFQHAEEQAKALAAQLNMSLYITRPLSLNLVQIAIF